MDGFKSLKDLGYLPEQHLAVKKVLEEMQANGLIEIKIIGKNSNGQNIIGYELIQQRPTTIM